MNDLITGKIIQQIGNAIYEGFRVNPLLKDSSVRAYGSKAKTLLSGEIAMSNAYDLDLSIYFPNLTVQTKNEALTFIDNLARNFSTPSLEISTADMTGPVKVFSEGKQALLLHIFVSDPESAKVEPKYVRRSMHKYGVQIYGQEPEAFHVERIGLTNILDEAKKGIARISANENINWTVTVDGKKEIRTPYKKNDALEYCAYACINSANNVVEVFSPYATAMPHYDDKTDALKEFSRIFQSHPFRLVPTELIALRDRVRTGQKVSDSGTREAALNFLAYTDDMLRNILGD